MSTPMCIYVCILVCIPTYILGPNKEEHLEYYPEDVAELCPNVHYLGKYMTFSFILLCFN